MSRFLVYIDPSTHSPAIKVIKITTPESLIHASAAIATTAPRTVVSTRRRLSAVIKALGKNQLQAPDAAHYHEYGSVAVYRKDGYVDVKRRGSLEVMRFDLLNRRRLTQGWDFD